jgi:hypothetical protein
MSDRSIWARLGEMLGWAQPAPLQITPQAFPINGNGSTAPSPDQSSPTSTTSVPPAAVVEIPPDQPGAEALSDLYQATLAYRTSKAYKELLDYMARFRTYSSYNLFLVRVQKPDAKYIATAKHWKQAFGRQPRSGSRALIMLQPGGPVMFVYDLADTDGKPAPKTLLDPFYTEGEVPGLVWKTVLKNCEREGFTVVEEELAPSQAGWVTGRIGERSVPPFFKITLNSKHNESTRFVTLAHELAHVYCGHLGGHPKRRWPDRSAVPVETREFEAESTAYIVAKRRRIESGSERYLSDYLQSHSEVPPLDVELVIRAADRIEKMGHTLRPPRKGESGQEND